MHLDFAHADHLSGAGRADAESRWRTLPRQLTSVIFIALLLAGFLPSGVGLLIAGAVIAMSVGAAVEVWLERRHAHHELFDRREIWTIMALLGLGTYAIRLSFSGAAGRARHCRALVLRLLRYHAGRADSRVWSRRLVAWPAATGAVRPIRRAWPRPPRRSASAILQPERAGGRRKRRSSCCT